VLGAADGQTTEEASQMPAYRRGDKEAAMTARCHVSCGLSRVLLGWGVLRRYQRAGGA